MNPQQLVEIAARSQALTVAIKAATGHPEPLDYFENPEQRSQVYRAISSAYEPAIRSLAVDLVATIDAALGEGTDAEQAARIMRDLHRTLRDHHAGGVLSVDIPTSGVARAMADLITAPALTTEENNA